MTTGCFRQTVLESILEQLKQRYRVLDEQLQKLQAQEASPSQWKAERTRLQAEAEREMQALWERVSRVLATSNKEFAKWEHYCREQGDLLHALEGLTAQERTMYDWITARITL